MPIADKQVAVGLWKRAGKDEKRGCGCQNGRGQGSARVLAKLSRYDLNNSRAQEPFSLSIGTQRGRITAHQLFP